MAGREGPLSQVFRNLIDNARSFSPPGGDVWVTLSRERGQAVVKVDDDGPGMPPENLETVFERFYTARPAGAAFGGNSGLGLSIARQIVEAHGGTHPRREPHQRRWRGDRRAVRRGDPGREDHARDPACRPRRPEAGRLLARRADQGPSGAGKSDLALRALDAGLRLVADDRVVVWASGGALWGRAPESLTGLIEARGHGVVRTSPLAMAEIVLAARCAQGVAIERMPDTEMIEVEGIGVPELRLDPFEASAPAKLRRALQHLGHSAQQAYQARSFGGGDRPGTGDTH